MPRIIDMECSVPYGATAKAKAAEAAEAKPAEPEPAAAGAPAQPGYGMANYGRIFRSRREGADHRPEGDLDAYMKHLATLGIVRSVPFGLPNAETGGAPAAVPRPLPRAGPHQHQRAQGHERGARAGAPGARRGLLRPRRLGAGRLHPASDRRYYPLYTKAAELGIPVRIYSSMNYANDRPYDLGHPRHLDQVAMDFPELKLIGGLGGWPWVNEMVALVRRHPNLHVDTSAHRARYLGQAGSGWEMLIQFGNTLIQDKVMVGLSAGLVGQPYETLIQEYLGLPLKDAVKEKWLYRNAARVFGLA